MYAVATRFNIYADTLLSIFVQMVLTHISVYRNMVLNWNLFDFFHVMFHCAHSLNRLISVA